MTRSTPTATGFKPLDITKNYVKLDVTMDGNGSEIDCYNRCVDRGSETSNGYSTDKFNTFESGVYMVKFGSKRAKAHRIFVEVRKHMEDERCHNDRWTSYHEHLWFKCEVYGRDVWIAASEFRAAPNCPEIWLHRPPRLNRSTKPTKRSAK